jgi:hypothetical protein
MLRSTVLTGHSIMPQIPRCTREDQPRLITGHMQTVRAVTLSGTSLHHQRPLQTKTLMFVVITALRRGCLMLPTRARTRSATTLNGAIQLPRPHLRELRSTERVLTAKR